MGLASRRRARKRRSGDGENVGKAAKPADCATPRATRGELAGERPFVRKWLAPQEIRSNSSQETPASKCRQEWGESGATAA